MTDYVFIEGIPVVPGTKAEAIALDFQKFIRARGLKGVNYRTGMKCGAWSLDIYLIPEDEKKPFFQKKCNGEHLLHRDYGFFTSGEKNEIMQVVLDYMINVKIKDLVKDFISCSDFYLDYDYEGKTVEELVGMDNAVVNQYIDMYMEANALDLSETERSLFINTVYGYQF